MILARLIDLLTRINKASREGRESFLHSETVKKITIVYENNVNITLDWSKKLSERANEIMKDD